MVEVSGRNEVRPVVQQKIRFRVQNGVHVSLKRFEIFAPNGVHMNTVVSDQAGRYVVLRAEGIGSAYERFRTARLDRRYEVRRLGRYVQAHADTQVFEWLFPRETVSYGAQYRHLAGIPLHASRAGIREIGIPNFKFHFTFSYRQVDYRRRA